MISVDLGHGRLLKWLSLRQGMNYGVGGGGCHIKFHYKVIKREFEMLIFKAALVDSKNKNNELKISKLGAH